MTPYKQEQARLRAVIRKAARLRDAGATAGEREAGWNAINRLVRRLWRLRPTRHAFKLVER